MDDKQRQKVLEQRLTDQLAAQQRSRAAASRLEAAYRTACAAYREAWVHYSKMDAIEDKRSADRAALEDALSDLKAAEAARYDARSRWQKAEQHAGSCSVGIAGAERDLEACGASVKALARAGA